MLIEPLQVSCAASEGQPQETIVETHTHEVGSIRNLNVANLQLHDALAAIPEMPPDQYVPFQQDVAANGVKKPILIDRKGKVVDGRHRLRASRETGHETIPCQTFEGSDEEIRDLIHRDALMRRHLTEDQRTMLAAQWAANEAKRSRTRRAQKAGHNGGRGRPSLEHSPEAQHASKHPDDRAAGSPTKRVRQQAAERAGVSEHRVREAQAVLAHDAATAEKVVAGRMPLHRAAKEVAARKGKRKPDMLLNVLRGLKRRPGGDQRVIAAIVTVFGPGNAREIAKKLIEEETNQTADAGIQAKSSPQELELRTDSGVELALSSNNSNATK